MRRKIKAWIGRKIMEIIASDFEREFVRLDNRMKAKIMALQAIDVDFHASGKIIICARTERGDRVKIIDTPYHCSMKEYENMVHQIESIYGASVRFKDVPMGMKNYFTGE